MIPYGRQNIDTKDVDAVVKVLSSDFLTQGPIAELFEKEVGKYCKVKYCTAVNSATSALHLACLAIGLNKDDYLWTSPNSFVASANCGIYCGAKIDFIDINKHSRNIDIDVLEEKLILAEVNGNLPKVIIPVHFAGQSCDMDRLDKLSKKYNFRIIEDASHAIGGEFLNNKIGSCQFSDITVFSFHPVKIITTGEGGVLTTNNHELDNKIKLLRSHGITRDPDKMQANEGPWYYEQIGLGYNYRMTDIHAALGCSQLEKLDYFIKARERVAERYIEELEGLDLILPSFDEQKKSSWHLFVINLPSLKCRRSIFEALKNKGIGVNVHYIPIYRQPFYKAMAFDYTNFAVCEDYYKSAITLPLFPDLKIAEQNYIIKNVRNLLQ